MSEQPVFSTNCRARNGQSDCSNARSKKLTQQSKVIKKALNYKVLKNINYLVVGGGGWGGGNHMNIQMFW